MIALAFVLLAYFDDMAIKNSLGIPGVSILEI
ncbi:MAG: hypothetical protein HNEKOMLI_00920 [Sodalis sp. Psp]|nr:hypothetical protein [Sodalis sp. Psp]